MREVIVWPTVRNILWQNLSEECYEDVCTRLVAQLERRYERLRTHRHPDDETLFVCTLYLLDDETRHTFEFHVDDTMADTSLFVLHKTDFRSAVQDYPDIAFEILREFSRRLRLADRRHRELMDEANAVSTIRATEDRSGKSQP